MWSPATFVQRLFHNWLWVGLISYVITNSTFLSRFIMHLAQQDISKFSEIILHELHSHTTHPHYRVYNFTLNWRPLLAYWGRKMLDRWLQLLWCRQWSEAETLTKQHKTTQTYFLLQSVKQTKYCVYMLPDLKSSMTSSPIHFKKLVVKSVKVHNSINVQISQKIIIN